MYDVVVVGYGPTGMMAGALLGRAGNRVAVIERYKSLYNLPRVGIVHDDVLRMFQELGISELIAPATFFLPVFELANKGQVLLSNKVAPLATHGWPEMTSIYQPTFEAELDVVVRKIPKVDVFQGETVVAFTQDADKVEVTIENSTGARRALQGRFLIGADGGNSFIRGALGVGWEDLGFDQDWLVIDGKAKRPQRPDLPPLRLFCEPEQPGMTMQMGPDHRRWAFMIFAHETLADAAKHENVWRRLNRPAGGTPDEFELVRVVHYRFQSLVAKQWRIGRAFLAGDAAHQMPPFLAQGLCSGFRDAYNLAWKLDLVLKGNASPALLDSYTAEREPNSRATVIESMRVAQNVNERDPEKVRRRDEQLMALQATREKSGGQLQLIAFRVPGFKQGLVATGAGAHGGGDVFPQGRVGRNGAAGLFDDVAGGGFLIIARNCDPEATLSPDDLAFWSSLGGRFVRLGGAGGELTDIQGQYTRLMDDYNCDVLVKRSDYYLFGACRSVKELPSLIADLRMQVGAGRH
jgi:2-polyprenyl-6-methoxyphenol hydroxylase-like FAD-dependent oxidoreductase